MHVFAPTWLIFPDEHLVQLLVPSLDANVPDIQEPQLVAPGVDAYLPENDANVIARYCCHMYNSK